jgi:hypothetical protein
MLLYVAGHSKHSVYQALSVLSAVVNRTADVFIELRLIVMNCPVVPRRSAGTVDPSSSN